MEPDVIRIYSSSPPPLEDGAEEDDDEFGDFGGFSGVPSSISFSELDTNTTLNETQTLNAMSPPEFTNNRDIHEYNLNSDNGTHSLTSELSMVNGIVPGGHLPGSDPETTASDSIKVLSKSMDILGNTPTDSSCFDCNGDSTQLILNGFSNFGLQGTPSSLDSGHLHKKGTLTEEKICISEGSRVDTFAGVSSVDGHFSQAANENPSTEGSCKREAIYQEGLNIEHGAGLKENVRDMNRTQSLDTCSPDRPPISTEKQRGLCHRDTGYRVDADFEKREMDCVYKCFNAESVCRKAGHTLNGVDVPVDVDIKNSVGCSGSDLSPEITTEGEEGQPDGKVSENETETETSLGRPLSTDALEDYGDMSTTGSPPLYDGMNTPADHSQLVEDDEDFGDFGDAGCFSGQGFADFEQLEVEDKEQMSKAKQDIKDSDDFAGNPKVGPSERNDVGKLMDFPVSESFGNFSSAVNVNCEEQPVWNAFEQPDLTGMEDDSWAAFSMGHSFASNQKSKKDTWHENDPANFTEETSRTDKHLEVFAPTGRLEKLFQSTFPEMLFHNLVEEVVSLKVLLDQPGENVQQEQEENSGSAYNRMQGSGVWLQLRDVHEAFGLRHQWGGSHCNKSLLCCLGIDIRNILFTGLKKQPIIVPMYAAGLGMLEPTKEPIKPVSAAEMIASIAQVSVMEDRTCSSDPGQEVFPPIQFDWSSSGLTNPLDANGGSSFLNLDFFGTVEDTGSISSPSIPGVDPELFELTTAKMDPNGSSKRMADAFARLMSTMEKTSTSTRKQRKDENLSEEAAKVIADLPDLSFMQAKVLMFPTTLTPLGPQVTPT